MTVDFQEVMVAHKLAELAGRFGLQPQDFNATIDLHTKPYRLGGGDAQRIVFDGLTWTGMLKEKEKSAAMQDMFDALGYGESNSHFTTIITTKDKSMDGGDEYEQRHAKVTLEGNPNNNLLFQLEEAINRAPRAKTFRRA